MDIQDRKKLARTFFPDCQLNDDHSDLETTDQSEIIEKKEKLLHFLQTMLFEEHLIEIQVDQGTRLFFSSLIDDPPGTEKNDLENGGEWDMAGYEHGSYLKRMDYFLMSPVTPGIGNLRIKNSRSIVLRFFTGTTAVELGCAFRKQETASGNPVLCLDFPVIGRITRNFRTFRVQTLSSVEAKVRPLNMKNSESSAGIYQIVDMSDRGMAFAIPGDKDIFTQGDTLALQVMVSGMEDLTVMGKARRITTVRDASGYKVICGIQFDLKTRALATELEKMAAAIQRLHLRELAERTADLKGVNIIR